MDETLKRLQDEYRKRLIEGKGKVHDEDLVEDLVTRGIYDAIKNDLVEFKGKQLSADDWLAMSPRERELHPFRTKSNDKFISNIYQTKDGELKIELTEEGERMEKLALLMGLTKRQFIQSIVKAGMGGEAAKQLAGVLFADTAPEKGNRRMK